MTPNHFLINELKTNKKRTKILMKRQEMMTIQRGNFLDYFYRTYHYKFIGVDLSRQANTNIPQ